MSTTPPFYLDVSQNEGIGTCWAYDGDPTIIADCPVDKSCCSLCQCIGCTQPITDKVYRDGIWYLDLGSTTRYADVRGRTASKRKRGDATSRNPIVFMGPFAITYLGVANNEAVFALFDRMHAHRVIREMKGGNTLYASPYVSGPNGSTITPQCHPFRAQWTKNPVLADGSRSSTLFHRWLRLRDGSDQEKFTCVEHLNDLALDCREENLRPSTNTAVNNAYIHRIKYAFWRGGGAGAMAKSREIMEEQAIYWETVRRCPPLPDSVFASKQGAKKRRRGKGVRRRPDLQPTPLFP